MVKCGETYQSLIIGVDCDEILADIKATIKLTSFCSNSLIFSSSEAFLAVSLILYFPKFKLLSG